MHINIWRDLPKDERDVLSNREHLAERANSCSTLHCLIGDIYRCRGKNITYSFSGVNLLGSVIGKMGAFRGVEGLDFRTKFHGEPHPG